MEAIKYSWVDKKEYPFKSKWIQLKAGKMHYIDEGLGEILIFLHGNPVWSFSYRKLIKGLSTNYRCIAIDHLGFGLSDKPSDFSYLPEDHSKNLEEFIETLALKNITLFVNDWGGPIGLNYATRNPNNIKKLVVFNTFMWSVKGDKHYERFSGFMGGKLGKFLNLKFNFFGNVVMKMAFGDKSKLDKQTKFQLTNHTSNATERKGVWVFPREIIGSSDWLNSIWQRRQKIENKPTLIIWGMKDIAFRPKELNVFKEFLKNREVIVLNDVGHYVQDEAADRIIEPIKEFLKK
jgi:haloalkane dehalogenase